MRNRLLAALAAFVLLAACSSTSPTPFAIYLLAQDIPTQQAVQTPLNQLPLAAAPILTTNDLQAYEWATHTMQLTPEAYTRIQKLYPLPVKVSGIPFVVTVGSQRIYAGALWTPLSSLSFDGVVIMQPFSEEPAPVAIEVGYPGSDFSTSDPRSDSRIKNALQAAGKLK